MASGANLIEKEQLTQTFNESVASLPYEPVHSIDFEFGVMVLDTSAEAAEHLHEKTQELDIEAFNYGQQEGGAEKASLMARNNQSKEHGTLGKAINEKKKNRDIFLKILVHQIQERLSKIRDKMDGLFDALKDEQRKIHLGLEILRERNVEAARLYLQNEFHVDTEGMSDKEIMSLVKDKVGQSIQTQQELIDEITKLAKDYEEKLNEHPELANNLAADKGLYEQYMKELEELKAEAERNKLDFEKAKYDVKHSMGGNNQLLDTVERKSYAQSLLKIDIPEFDDPFAQESFAEQVKDIRPTPVFNAAANDSEPPKPDNPSPNQTLSAQGPGIKPQGMN